MNQETSPKPSIETRVLIIPAFNEEKNLPHVLPKIAESLPEYELVVIDDGSRDKTATVAASYGAKVLKHPFNMGYGAAIQTGYKYARMVNADLLIQMDADGQHDPGQVPELVDPILKDECDLMIGSRFLLPTSYKMGGLKSAGRHLFRRLAAIFGLDITDPTSGFQAMNRKVLDVYCEDFFPRDYPDVDVLVILHRRGHRIRECSVEMSEGLRGSYLHGGLKPLYYVYKMLLSLWAAAATRDPSR